MARRKNKELDSVYFLKLVLYLILGSLWVKLTRGESLQVPIPVGLFVGLLFAAHEHFKLDKKIEYALLLHSCFVGFWLPFGIFVTF